MTSVSIQAANFWPWLGWFDKARVADWFILGDQTEIGPEFRRTRISAPGGETQWLTMPMSCGRTERIDRATIATHEPWQDKMHARLQTAYAKHPYWEATEELVEGLHRKREWTHLRDLNEEVCITVARMLGLKTRFVRASDLTSDIDDREERILAYCQAVGADTLLSGPNARQYRDYELMRKNGIRVLHHRYPLPEYEQKGLPSFAPYLSVLDALVNVGLTSTKMLLVGRFEDP